MDGLNALDEAVAKAGGVNKLSLSLNKGKSIVSMWRQRGRVPAEYCPTIERLYGVECERLRPDVEWSVLVNRKAA